MTKNEGPEGPSSTTPQSRLCAYFFFDDFLLLDFFDEDLEDFFDAAILLTTFHAVRDLPVAPTWQQVPDCSGIFLCEEGKVRGDSSR